MIAVLYLVHLLELFETLMLKHVECLHDDSL